MTFSYPGEKNKIILTQTFTVFFLAQHKTVQWNKRRENIFWLLDFILAVSLPRERSYSPTSFYSGSNADFS